MSTLIILQLFSIFSSAYSSFTPDFTQFLEKNYGVNLKNKLLRSDLGSFGSFGGRTSSDQKENNQPVIFVHGVNDLAGQHMMHGAKYFMSQGYSQAELYATTYFTGAQNNGLKFLEYTMACKFVKQIRHMITAVRMYTGQKVDVVAFSLGVPIARKAILGGKCVDTFEDIGGRLTDHVDTFVGVAGPNHGINYKVGDVSMPLCMFSLFPICNLINGLYSGICPVESKFLEDINSQKKYEGQHVFSIYSKADQIIGHKICNKVTGRIPGQEGERVIDNLKHDPTFYNTHHVQLSMVKHHRA